MLAVNLFFFFFFLECTEKKKAGCSKSLSGANI